MEKVPWHEKLCYGISSWSGCLSSYLTAGYLTLFATDVVGVKAAAVGGLILICEIFDAVTDVLVVNLADRTHTRWGKYRPWLLCMGLPLALALVFLFWNPSFLETERQKLLWLFISYFLLSPVCLTGYLCSQYIMLSVITTDEHDRLGLGSARSVGEFAAELMVNTLCMTLVLYFGKGSYRDVTGWRYMILCFAALTVLGSFCGFLGTKERVHITNLNGQGEQLTLFEKLRVLVTNSVYRKTLALNAGLMFAVVETVLFSYFCIYDLGHEEWIAPLYMLGTLVSMAVSGLIPTIGRIIRKRTMIYIGCLFMLLAAVICLNVQSFFAATLYVICKGTGYGLTISCCGVLLASCADYIEKNSKVAVPGMVMAFGSFVQKLLMGVCTLIGTLILSLGGYNAALQLQSQRTMFWIRWGIAGFLALAALIAFMANLGLNELEK